jgi:hypothetical protein
MMVREKDMQDIRSPSGGGDSQGLYFIGEARKNGQSRLSGRSALFLIMPG